MKSLILISVISLTVFHVFSQQKDINHVFPGALEDPMLIYHVRSKAMLLLGGTPVIQDSVRSDVWKWDGSTWSKLDAKGPGSRVFFKGGLNLKTGDIELFAGAGLARTNSLMKDLWSFDGKKWSKKAANDIGSHDHFKMVYADHLKAFVMYGGNVDHHFDTVTWLMQDGKFTAVEIPGPGIKYQSGMVYDRHRKKVVLYGGGQKADEHWEFDGKEWEKIVTQVNPGVKMYHHMVYDENLKAVVLHGGQINHRPLDPKNLETPLTWLWDGQVWRNVAQEKIFPIAAGYHPTRGSVIAYGYDDGNINTTRNLALWEFRNYKWIKIADYGAWNTLGYLENHLRENPSDLMAQYTYAFNLKNQNRLPEAEVVFKNLTMQKIPQQASVLRGLIDVLKSLGKLDEAEVYISKYAHDGDTRMVSTMYYNLACSYALTNNTDKAFTALHHAVTFGYRTRKDYESDPDLESLKADPRWKGLLLVLE
jgi:hypothetical protein